MLLAKKPWPTSSSWADSDMGGTVRSDVTELLPESWPCNCRFCRTWYRDQALLASMVGQYVFCSIFIGERFALLTVT